MNLHEWQYVKTKNFKEGAKSALREGFDMEHTRATYSQLSEQHWDEIVEELDAEDYVVELNITEATDTTPQMISNVIKEYVDFIPGEGKKYWLTFVGETVNVENAQLISAVMEKLGADDFVVERLEDGNSMITFKEVAGQPVVRRTNKLQENALTLAVVEPGLSTTDIKRAKVLEKIYGE